MCPDTEKWTAKAFGRWDQCWPCRITSTTSCEGVRGQHSHFEAGFPLATLSTSLQGPRLVRSWHGPGIPPLPLCAFQIPVALPTWPFGPHTGRPGAAAHRDRRKPNTPGKYSRQRPCKTGQLAEAAKRRPAEPPQGFSQERRSGLRGSTWVLSSERLSGPAHSGTSRAAARLLHSGPSPQGPSLLRDLLTRNVPLSQA